MLVPTFVMLPSVVKVVSEAVLVCIVSEVVAVVSKVITLVIGAELVSGVDESGDVVGLAGVPDVEAWLITVDSVNDVILVGVIVTLELVVH